VGAVSEELPHVFLLEAGGKGVNLPAEFLESQARFMDGACRHPVEIASDEREQGEQGKALEGQENPASRAFPDGIQHPEVPKDGSLVDHITGGWKRG